MQCPSILDSCKVSWEHVAPVTRVFLYQTNRRGDTPLQLGKISARFARPTCRLASKEINPWILTSQHKVLQWIVRPCSAVLFQLGTLTWCAASAALIMSAAGFGGNGVPSFWAHQGKPETPSEICFSARKYEHSKIRFHPPGPMSHSQKNVKTNQ